MGNDFWRHIRLAIQNKNHLGFSQFTSGIVKRITIATTGNGYSLDDKLNGRRSSLFPKARRYISPVYGEGIRNCLIFACCKFRWKINRINMVHL